MQKIELHKVCKIGNGFAFKSEDYLKAGIPLLRISNINNGVVNFKDDTICVAENYLETKKDFIVEKGDVVIALSGATTGKYGIYISNEPALLNQRIGIIKSNVSKKLDSKYFYFYLNILKDEILRKAGGAAQPNISTKEIGILEIPLPNLPTQQKIATILDKADELRQYNKQLIEKYDALTQSLFLDMFGDPVNNEKGWEKKKLGDLGVFKNGLNYSKSANGKKVKILGVGDFKDYWKISNYDNLSIIEIESFPSKDFLLEDGDLIFVRSNGNKDLVGRCLIAYPNGEKVTYSGFCIRFRKNNSHLNEMYLVQLMRNKLFKKYIFKNGRGANIQNINQELLSNIEIQLPPLNLQNQFAERVQLIEIQKQQAQEALAKSENLFQSLLQRAFKGELN
ncbi:restriction endonuclease subunit S [Flavobacterium sp. XS2P14]|uniref:restriction endonuclease subunit S n=1 Tax=Flavobacterium sp. XS2P14 TaxID=3401735 RepID=UPI003AAD612C